MLVLRLVALFLHRQRKMFRLRNMSAEELGDLYKPSHCREREREMLFVTNVCASFGNLVK